MWHHPKFKKKKEEQKGSMRFLKMVALLNFLLSGFFILLNDSL